MRNKLSFIALAFALFAITNGCRKEFKEQAKNPAQAQIKGNSKRLDPKNEQELLKEEYKQLQEESKKQKAQTAIILKKAEEYKIARAQFRKSHADNVINYAARGRGVIKVPLNYPTVQEAIDHAQTGDMIMISGTINNPADILVDVPGITIKGESGATLNFHKIFFLAQNIELSNLKLNLTVVISNVASGAKLQDNIISSLNETVPATLVTMDQVSGCVVKNNSIKDVGNTLSIGILATGGTGNLFESNEIRGGNETFRHINLVNSNNNQIKNCTVKSGGIERRTPTIGYYFEGEFSGNIISNCRAEEIIGSGLMYFDRYAPSNNQIINCIVNKCSVRGIRLFDLDANPYEYINSGGGNNLIRDCKITNGRLTAQPSFGNYGIILVSNNSTVKDCISDNNNGGFQIFGSNNKLSNCIAKNCFSAGITFVAGDLLFGSPGGGNVTNCEAINNSQNGEGAEINLLTNGITIQGYNVTVSNCKTSNNEGSGILCSSVQNSRLTGNESRNNLKDGIRVFQSNNLQIKNNRASNNRSCDYNNIFSDDITLQGNSFGKTCVYNPWIVPSTSPVQPGNALKFDGILAASIPDPLLNNATDFTLETWVYWTEESTAEQRIFDFGNFDGYMFLTPNGVSGVPRFAISNGLFGTEESIDAAGPISLNTWHHIAVAAGGGVGNLYIDGVLAGTNNNMTLTPASIPNNYSSTAALGAYIYGGYNNLNGQLDDVRIWNVVRTQQQIAANKNMVVPANSAGLVAYYKLDGVSGRNLFDEVSNTNNGLIYGDYGF